MQDCQHPDVPYPFPFWDERLMSQFKSVYVLRQLLVIHKRNAYFVFPLIKVYECSQGKSLQLIVPLQLIM